MDTIKGLQEEIRKLKKEKDVCILAHAYQSQDILEIADYVGDSYGLSVKAADAAQRTMLMCGVRFMAETVKILSPHKTVLLSHAMAGCPMAEQFSVDDIRALKEQYPGYAVAAYINTTAELKTVCDVCVTSSSAVKIIRSLENKQVLFIPDCSLGAWVAAQVPEKEIQLVQGGCPVHRNITAADVKAMRNIHPGAKLLVHPECLPEVAKQADYVGSTTGIMDYVKESEAVEFLIGTENSIVQHLQFAYKKKRFYPLSAACICSDMRLTTLVDVYDCINGTGGEQIVLPDAVMDQARGCIQKMMELERK